MSKQKLVHLNFETKRDKKFLLRERKRHTARRVVSTPSVVLTGNPPPILTWLGGTLPGYPPAGTHRQGTPWQGTSWQGTPWQGTPRQGTPWVDLTGYPPRCLPYGFLGNVAKHYGIWLPPQVWTN